MDQFLNFNTYTLAILYGSQDDMTPLPLGFAIDLIPPSEVGRIRQQKLKTPERPCHMLVTDLMTGLRSQSSYLSESGAAPAGDPARASGTSCAVKRSSIKGLRLSLFVKETPRLLALSIYRLD
ncbi:hypothetical protein SAMN05216228_10855 [Rhizobium tibeticum]|uniref:Uncharacterized protein n=1 Tax=Rhizobium tibeticum TaxID=501024 RepID=A0A1H8WXX4_9HYPH|nr:hypothetical protein [Rhizobium tibeticum]SEI21928.1 hypothetical protein RTCCBAU85039_6763 [Rhizobium tibeticum]SEP32560.1 hypothetical protein SAMN05216228_10855 [Rhizobium tibeticum]